MLLAKIKKIVDILNIKFVNYKFAKSAKEAMRIFK